MSHAEPMHRHAEDRPVEAPLASRYAKDQLLGPLLKEYVADLPRVLAELLATAHAGDTAALRRVAHRLAGDSATYGFPELSHVALELEQLAFGPIDSTRLVGLLSALQRIGRRIAAGAPV